MSSSTFSLLSLDTLGDPVDGGSLIWPAVLIGAEQTLLEGRSSKSKVAVVLSVKSDSSFFGMALVEKALTNRPKIEVGGLEGKSAGDAERVEFASKDESAKVEVEGIDMNCIALGVSGSPLGGGVRTRSGSSVREFIWAPAKRIVEALSLRSTHGDGNIREIDL
jgi:hypothetical protein